MPPTRDILGIDAENINRGGRHSLHHSTYAGKLGNAQLIGLNAFSISISTSFGSSLIYGIIKNTWSNSPKFKR